MRQTNPIKEVLRDDLRRLGIQIEDGSSPFSHLKLLVKRNTRVLVLLRVTLSNYIILASASRWLLRRLYGIEIFKGSQIGPGVLIPHPRDIIIGPNSQLGSWVNIGQGVTIGGNMKKTKPHNNSIQYEPIIKDGVFIGPNAVIGGPVVVGKGSIIGANTVVTRDIEENSLVIGHNQVVSQKHAFDPINNTVLRAKKD